MAHYSSSVVTIKRFKRRVKLGEPAFGPHGFLPFRREAKEHAIKLPPCRSPRGVFFLGELVGIFPASRLHCARRFADMIQVRLESNPDHLFFRSVSLAEKDWTDYADTYGATIKKILSHLEI
jgi:hypothetical protein